ncbi:MAG: hypothetical protein EBS01_03015, partial [Verrucomicrobia bacterium]|nr:hypothetical protein [Verrucomicrobiota bacterium]
MKRSLALFLAGPILFVSQAAPIFDTGTGTVTTSGDFSGYINLGLQGVGRISASQLDAFGETFGSVSGLQITNWKLSNGAYTGSFLTLPDRGYNSGAVYSDYRTRVQQVDFSFTPYTGTTALSSSVNQISLRYMGGSLLTINDGPANTTGALPTTSAALQVGTLTTGMVPKTAGGKISLDAEGLALLGDGSGYVSDEYGPNVFYIQNGNITSVINPPASAMPRTSTGSLTYTVSGTSAPDPTTGRRGNQGMEGVAVSPDGKTLFTMLQSATMQDSTSGSQNRQYTRLYKYDITNSRSNPTLLAEYVVELPRFNDTNANQTGLTPNKTGAQSEIVALDGDRIMLLSRDSNGNGGATAAPAVFKSVMIADLTRGGTNILSQDITSDFTVKNGTVSTSLSGDFTTKLKDGITAVSPVQFVSIIDATQLAKFGLNTNDGSSAARTSATLSEKWEGMALVSALDASRPNDYFLFVANDNDFLTTKLKMKATDGTTVTTAGSLGVSVENDTMFLAYRVTLPVGTDTTLRQLSLSSTPSQAAVSVVDGGTTLSAGSSTYDISATTLLVPGSLTITRPVDVGTDGGALNLLGNRVVLSGSVSGAGALTVFGTSSASALTLSGTNSYSGGTEVNATRLQVSAASNLGTGQINLNTGATLALTESGSFSNAAGYYVGGGTMEVASGKGVVWNGSLTGPGSLTKSGGGTLELKGSSTGFSGGVSITAGTLSVGSGTTTWSAGSGSLSLASGSRLNVLMSGTVDLTNKIAAVPNSSIYWTGSDSSSVLKLNTTIPKIYNTNNVGSISLGLTSKILIYANGLYYQPFDVGLAVGTPVYMDAEGSLLSATQRSLGYREVAYKNLFFSSLGFTAATTTTDSDGNTIYNYGNPSTSSNLVGYWTKKNLPIIIGADGKGYITDGHHTTAGYLASGGTAIIAGKNHIVLGTIVSNPSSQTSVNDQMWTDFANSNNAYLYGTNGNQLIQPGETQGAASYSGLQPILPTAGGAAMPTTPGTSSMTNDLYRSLTWGMADGIVKTASNVGGTKLPGYLKLDPYSATGADVNFIEFYWADFLRGRVLWNDGAAVTSPNLINAPVAFFAAVANGIALAKSELYVDQFGRSLTDYINTNFSQNTQTWAKASLKNGLAATGDTYNLFLTDDSTVQGDILASAVDGVVSNLSINTGTGMTVAGALHNFTSIAVNTGGTITIDWKDTSVNGVVGQNKLLTIAAGSADVVFSGDNNYRKLSTLVVGAGTLTFNTDNAYSDQVIWGDISGAGALAKAGEGALVLGGSNTFAGGITLSKGALVLDRTSILSDSGQLLGSPVGLGTLFVTPSSDAGATLAFTENVLLKNRVVLTGAGITLEVDSNAVELAGDVAFDSNPVSLYGPNFSALTLSGTGNTAANLVVYGMNLRAGIGALVDGSTITLNGGATLSPARQFTLSAGSLASDDLALNVSLVIVDEGKLNAGGGTLTMNGVISGDGKLVIGADSAFGAVQLTNANTFTGGVAVQDGATLKFTNDGNLGDAAGSVTLESGVLSYTGGAPLVMSASRSLVVSQSGLLDAGSGALTWAGEITGTGDLTVGSEDTTGSLILSSGSSSGFAGRVIVGGGSLVIAHASALASAAVDLRNTSRLSDSGGYVSGGTIAFTGISSGTFGSLAGDRALALPSNFGLTVGGDQSSSVYSGSVSGSGASLTKVGSGAFTLSGENSYSGVTEVQGGLLRVSNKKALSQSTLNLISGAGAVVFSTSEVFLGGLSGSGSLNITDGRRFIVGGNNLSTTYSGVLTGATGVFEKAGTGNLTLAGTSTFRGEVS